MSLDQEKHEHELEKCLKNCRRNEQLFTSDRISISLSYCDQIKPNQIKPNFHQIYILKI